ncbi:hypothetical protein E2C01_061083 [Portunus trituberculatus]|uniref:Uncharacterized protein n=1 Tax=Portunus trituberculatus TaxID=210409 RepID=A0A5B7HAE7_PORTR|nr:hypothetical protein [Portunus trituberculatus]
MDAGGRLSEGTTLHDRGRLVCRDWHAAVVWLEGKVRNYYKYLKKVSISFSSRASIHEERGELSCSSSKTIQAPRQPRART